jgi:very-short-patch-repair endonuclease/cytochrome c556
MPPSTRSYQRSSSEEIETVFRRSRTDRSVLLQICEELRQRETAKARTLLVEVERELWAANMRQIAEQAARQPPPPQPAAAVAATPQTNAARIKIAELRQRLLDLTNKNRLINFKHSGRGGRQIRIVGEWLPDLLKILDADRTAELFPLPPLSTDPEDEQKPEFLAALEEALLTDKPYLNAVAKASKGTEDEVEFGIAKAERALKDRLRKKLGWASRASLVEISVTEHARRLNINPSYELNDPDPRRNRRRVHQWQTLLPEDELDRRLRSIAQQAKESREEYGVETLYLSLGFLEWPEATRGGLAEAPNFSPILLVPLSISELKRQNPRTADGTLLLGDGEPDAAQSNKKFFGLQLGSDDITVNICLRERLRKDFGFILPEWDEDLGVEAYLAQISSAIRQNPGWKLKSWATISHLSYSRLAMWIDLDPDKPGMRPPHVHPVLSELLGGREPSENPATDRPPQHPEEGVPCLVMDCDSSQFAAIRDVLKGKNLTIQGPPGTGKSQTIGNLIASLMHQGKSVLFVAEKMAALDVVQSRLTKAGLGDFILELHSAKAGKKRFLESLKKRLQRQPRTLWDGSGKVVKKRTVLRDRLNAYAAAINSQFGASGMTVHDIIWRHHAYHDRPLPEALVGLRLSEAENWDADAVESRRAALVEHAERHRNHLAEQDAGEHPWNWVANSNLHVEERERLYSHVLDLIRRLSEIEEWLALTKIVSPPNSIASLRALAEELANFGGRPEELHSGLWEFSAAPGAARSAKSTALSHGRLTTATREIADLAPGLPDDAENAAARIAALGSLAATLLPGSKDSSTVADFESRRKESEDLTSRLDEAGKLISKLSSLIPALIPTGAEEMKAASRFVQLASNAPQAILSKAHRLGEDGATVAVNERLAAFKECETENRSLAENMSVPPESLDSATVGAHIAELENSGLFAFLRSKHRAAVRFCKNGFPKVQAEERLPFARRLAAHLQARESLAKDPELTRIAGELFKGWSTKTDELRDACFWIEKVRTATPALERDSPALRSALFQIKQDDAAVAKLLAEQNWVTTFEALAERCEVAGASLATLSVELTNEQTHIACALEAMDSLAWNGALSHPALKRLEAASQARAAAQREISASRNVLELLLPDPAASLENVRTLAATHLRIATLPLQQVWRDRLAGPRSHSDWEDLKAVSEAMRSKVETIEGLLESAATLASSNEGVTQHWRRITTGDAIKTLRRSADNRQALTTRSRYLASNRIIRDLELFDVFRGATGIAMARFDGIGDLFSCVYLRSMAFLALERSEALNEFRHVSPGVARQKFSELDAELKGLHQRELADRLMDRPIPEGIGYGLIKDRTELGLLEHIANLEKPKTSIHKILTRAGRAMQAIKPCFMMSPLSVAQLIEREKLKFDVVIFDEASQVRPEDALCALARGTQFVVVGDQMQLPPTSFGEKSAHEDLIEDDDGEAEEPSTVESILELASAAYGDGRTLLWHYRSRDPQLIAFSNREFYRNELLLFPSPQARSPATGVKYVWTGGHYSARTNVIEATACAQAALDFMRTTPNRSLGIVALNRPQADLIELELRKLMHDDEAAQKYRTDWEGTLEPFFIKNLENVQGDERDVMFVSTVFGFEESGRFYQRFGPINSSVGHRRLNVLFTRAKHQLVLFTSLPTEEIVVSETSNWGVRALKQYLEFARTGRLEGGTHTGKSADSPFEISVRAALEAAGHQCEPQVGVAGFFIDLAVKHPRYPDYYMLGIECDGASYHSGVAARDRDRLRQAVLESFDWKIHRVWSTDWFSDPRSELAKLLSRLKELEGATPFASGNAPIDFESRFGKPRTFKPAEGPDDPTQTK